MKVMKMSIKLHVVILLVLFAIGICSSSFAEQISLRVWKFGSPSFERDYMKSRNKVFEKENPNIRIEWVYQLWGTKRKKVLSACAAGNLPDLLLIDGQSIPEFVTMRIVVPLDQIDPELVKSWKPRFVPEIWDLGIWKGKVYGMSTYVDMTPMMAYNTKMFIDAGITDDKGIANPPLTWEELLKVAKKLHVPPKHFGVIIAATTGTNDVNIFEGIAYANGGRWLDEKKENVVINGPGTVNALDFWVKLSKYAEPGFAETNFRQAAQLFFQSKGAMYMTMSFAPLLKAQFEVPEEFEYKLTAAPKKKQPSGRYSRASSIMTPTTVFMVTSASEYKKEAMKYVDFWAQYEQQKGWDGSVVMGRIPAMKVSFETDSFRHYYPDLAKLYEQGKLFEGSLSMPAFPGITEAEDRLGLTIQEALFKIKSPQQTLNELQKVVQKIYNASREK